MTKTTDVSPPPIMLRASITADEWRALRRLALDLNMSSQQLVADALRLAYNLNGATTR